MGLPALAELEAFVARLPESIENADFARVQALLDDASDLVRLESGRNWKELDDDNESVWVEYDDVINVENAHRVVAQITIAAAARAFTNPDGITQETIGAFSETRSSMTVSNSVWLLDSEKKALGRLFGAPALASVEFVRPEGEFLAAAPYDVPVDDGSGDPIPWFTTQPQ